MTLRDLGVTIPAICTVCSKYTHLELRTIAQDLRENPVTVVARRWDVHPASMRRHRLNHTELALVKANVRTTEERSVMDSIDDLIDSFDAAIDIRTAAIKTGHHEQAIRAIAAQRAVTKQLHDALGIDAAEVRGYFRETSAFLSAVQAAIKAHPVIAKLLATKATGDMRADLERLYEVAQKAQAKEKEGTAA